MLPVVLVASEAAAKQKPRTHALLMALLPTTVSAALWKSGESAHLCHLFFSIPSPSAHATPQRPPESMGDAAKKHAHLTPEELAEFREIFNLVDLDKVP